MKINDCPLDTENNHGDLFQDSLPKILYIIKIIINQSHSPTNKAKTTKNITFCILICLGDCLSLLDAELYYLIIKSYSNSP